MSDLLTNQITHPEAEPWAFWDIEAENELTWVAGEFGADGKFVNALGVDMETGYNIYDVEPVGDDDHSFEDRLAELDATVAITHPPATDRILAPDIGPSPKSFRVLDRVVTAEVVEGERKLFQAMVLAEAGQEVLATATTGTEGRMAMLMQDMRPRSELHPPGYKQAVLMARFLLGKGEANTDFHVTEENGLRDTTGYLAQFCIDGASSNEEAHTLFLDALEIAPDDLPEPGSPYDGEPEIVKMVLDGAGVITRQVIRVPDDGSMIITYLAQHNMPTEETLVEMGFPVEELVQTQEVELPLVPED